MDLWIYINTYYNFIFNHEIIYLSSCAVIGFIALSRGRNLIAWIILSAIISPIIALIALLIQADLRRESEDKSRHEEIINTINNQKK